MLLTRVRVNWDCWLKCLAEWEAYFYKQTMVKIVSKILFHAFLSKVLYHIASITVPLLHSGSLISFYSILGHFFSFSLVFSHLHLPAGYCPATISIAPSGILNTLLVSLVSLVHLLSLLLTDKSFQVVTFLL